MAPEKIIARKIMERLNMNLKDASGYGHHDKYINILNSEHDIEEIIKTELAKAN